MRAERERGEREGVWVGGDLGGEEGEEGAGPVVEVVQARGSDQAVYTYEEQRRQGYRK